MEESSGRGGLQGNAARLSSIRSPPGSFKSSLSGRSSSRNSPSFRRLNSSRTPRRDSKAIGGQLQWVRSNRVVFWLMLIAVWAYVGFHVQSKWAHSDHSKAEFVGYKSEPGSVHNPQDLSNVSNFSTGGSVEGLAVVKGTNISQSKMFDVSFVRKGRQVSSRQSQTKKTGRRSERRLRRVAVKAKSVVAENRTGEMDEGLIPKRNTSYGLIVGPFGKTEDSVLEWSVEKRRGTCDRKGELAHIVWSRSFVLIFHELSMTGAPLSMMELATELMSCGGTVSVVVLSRKGGLMAELERRGIKVLNDRAALSFKTAMKADLVIAGSAVCSNWIESYLTHFPAGSSQIVWWIMENRREYFDRSKHMLNRVKMLTFLSDAQSKKWLSWCEEEHIQLNVQPMMVPLSVNDELAFVAGLPCSLNTPAFSVEKMIEKKDQLRSAVRKEMGLSDNDMLVMSLSSINPGKGQRLLLESALFVAEHNVSLKDFQVIVKEPSGVASQNGTRMDNELSSDGTNSSNEPAERSQKSTTNKTSSKKRRKRRSRTTNILSFGNRTKTETPREERKLRNLLSENDSSGEQSLRLLIGSIGSKSNKVLYIKAILRFLSQHSNLSKSVLWTPATTRVASLYAAADAYVINAQGLGETFGRVTVEAMAFGLPVLGTDAGGTREIVEHGATGLLHPLGREGIEVLAKNIQFLLSNPTARKKMGMNGRLKVQNMYMKHHTYKSLAKVIVKCMKIK